jgi:hypothetical protein
MELKRMRVLMQEMRDRLSFNREQTARLLEQFGRRLVKDNGGQKLRQSA